MFSAWPARKSLQPTQSSPTAHCLVAAPDSRLTAAYGPLRRAGCRAAVSSNLQSPCFLGVFQHRPLPRRGIAGRGRIGCALAFSGFLFEHRFGTRGDDGPLAFVLVPAVKIAGKDDGQRRTDTVPFDE